MQTRKLVLTFIILLILAASVGACEKDSLDNLGPVIEWEAIAAVDPTICEKHDSAFLPDHDTADVFAEWDSTDSFWRDAMPDSGWVRWVVMRQGDIARVADSPNATISTAEIAELVGLHTAGVAPPFHGDTLDPPHDTAREYMTVDTVFDTIFCPSTMWECDSSMNVEDLWFRGRQMGCVKTIINTTWHPKVQVWLTPGELEVFDKWMSGLMPCETHGHDWYGTGLAATSFDPHESRLLYLCFKCDAEEWRDD